MSKSKKIRLVTTILGVALAVTLLIGSVTFSYLQDKTDTVTNVFNTNKIELDLTETTGTEFDIIPGTTQTKDPVLKIENTVDADIVLIVYDHTDGLVNYELNLEGWEKIGRVGPNDWVYVRSFIPAGEYITNSDGESIWVQKGTTTPLDNEIHLLKNDRVSYDAALENTDMTVDGTKDGALKDSVYLAFEAYTLQSAGFDHYRGVTVFNNVMKVYNNYHRYPIKDSDPTNILRNNSFSLSVIKPNGSRGSGYTIIGEFSEDIPIEDSDSNQRFDFINAEKVDLNGHSLVDQTTDHEYGGFYAQSADNAVIRNGSIFTGSRGIWLDGTRTAVMAVENVNIFSDAGEAVYNSGGLIKIRSGYYESRYSTSFQAAGDGGYATLNIEDRYADNGSGSFLVSGGTFKNFDPGNNVSDGLNTNYLASCHKTIGVKLSNTGEVLGDASDFDLGTNYDNEDYAYYFVVVPSSVDSVNFQGFTTVTASTKDGSTYTGTIPLFTY